jgi:hypothetical protein
VIPAPDIPGHSITGVLGTGGFATVYRSWQVAVGREVAVKVDSRVLLSERDQRRFIREVTAAGRLSGHPHVIDVYDAGLLGDGRPYLVMELCPGGSLNDELRRRGPMSVERVRHIGIGIGDALAAAHAAGVLHRDIKPANILINRYGIVGLSDFGLASIIAGGGQQSVTRDALTPAYAPPETFRGEEPTVAADTYSLAATLYALLAGRPPHFPAEAASPGLATIRSFHGQPVDDIPAAPPELMAVLRQCLAADPAARLPTAGALRDALTVLSPEPVRLLSPAAPGSPAPQAAPPGQAAPADPAAPAGPPALAVLQAPAGAVPRAPGRRLPAGAVTLASGIALLVVAVAVGVSTYLRAPGKQPNTAAPSGVHAAPMDPAPEVFGIPTVTSRCPAASVAAAAARCPQDPECWAGTVDIEGSVSAQSEPCSQPHSWETFAIGILPSDVSTFDQDIVQANPAVRATCSLRVLLRSRVGRARLIPAKEWEIQVMPPDEAAYYSGARAYRCLATPVNGPYLAAPEFGG